MISDDEDDLSTPLSPDDNAAIAALTTADVTAIDAVIMSVLTDRWQKTAFVVARAMYAYPDQFDDIPDVFYGRRIVQLAADGAISSQGDLRRLRFSELRRKTTGDVLAK